MNVNENRGPGRPATVIPGADVIIARERANGASWASCAHALNAAGLERPTGGPWTGSAVASYARVQRVDASKPEPTEWWPAGSAETLASARRRAGFTMGELAKLAGVSRMTVFAAETGRAVPQRATARSLWRVLRDEKVIV